MITKMTIHNVAKGSFLSQNGHLLFFQFLLLLFIFSFTVLCRKYKPLFSWIYDKKQTFQMTTVLFKD